jgi:hypothetical protein
MAVAGDARTGRRGAGPLPVAWATAVAALAVLVVALAAAPWAGRGTLASTAQVWGDGRPDVHGEFTPLPGGARLTLWNGGGLPARVVLHVTAQGATPALRVAVREVGDGARRLLYAGGLDGLARLDLGRLAAGGARTLEIEAAAGGGGAPPLRVAWTAVAGG